MNPFLMEMMIKERREEMLKEAERQRLVALYEASNPTRKARIFISLGDFLIQAGERIKKRYAPKIEIALDPCKGNF